MKELRTTELTTALQALLNDVEREPEKAQVLVADLQDNSQAVFIYLSVAGQLPKDTDKQAVAGLAKAVISLVTLKSELGQLGAKSAQAHRQLSKELQPVLDACVTIVAHQAGIIMTYGRAADAGAKCLAAIRNLADKVKEVGEKAAALVACIAANPPDTTEIFAGIPDICSWKHTELKQAEANLKAARTQAERDCQPVYAPPFEPGS